MADFVPFVVMSVEDPRLASFGLDAPEHCWVLCEVDPAGKVARVVNWDGGEPEDQLLVRDWDWVPRFLNDERAARDIECDVLRTTLARLTADLAAVTSERDMWRSECESISAELDLPPGIRPAEGEFRRMLDHRRALLAERDALGRSLDASASTVALLAAELRAKYAERLNDDYATKAVGGLMARGEATERAELAERELAEARVDLTNCADVGRRLEIELRRAVAEAAEADTTRREWEVRAAESYAAGRAAGLREAAEACDAQAESWPESPESWFADPGMRHEAVTRRAHRNEAKSCAAKIRRALAPPAAETEVDRG